MKGAIIFSGKYGSTEQYAKWISEATGLPTFNIKQSDLDLTQFDYFVLGSSILYFKLSIRHWVRSNISEIEGKTKILFSVSGAGPGEKLDQWVANSLPSSFLSNLKHIGLRGKLDHSKVSWWIKMILYIGSLFNSDQEGSKDEKHGFDYMDKESIAPIVQLIKEMEQSTKTEENGE